MPEKTYVLRFTRVDGETEYCEHNDREDAVYHFSLFDESDRDIYREIVLIEHDWTDDSDTTIAKWRY